MRGAVAGVISFLIIALFFFAATEVEAVIEINGKCMDDCRNEGNDNRVCVNQCTVKPDDSNSVAPIEKKPTGYECILKCRNQGNTPDFCKSLCSQ